MRVMTRCGGTDRLMDAERREGEIKDATQEMARGGEHMEERLDELESDIQDAKKTAAQRQDAPEKARDAQPPEAEAEGDDVAGDWQGESSGSGHGEDAEDAADGTQVGADASGEAEEADGEDDGPEASADEDEQA